MRIAYLNPALKQHGPGPAVHGRALATHLRALGAEVDVVPPDEPSMASASEARTGASGAAAVLRRQAKRVLSPSVQVARSIRSVQAGRRALKAADVVLVRHVGYGVGPMLVKRLWRKTVVVEVNAAIYKEQSLVGVSGRPMLAALERAAWRAADRIYAVTKQVAESVIECGVDPARVGVIPNGADPGEPLVPREVRGEAEIVFVGSLHPWQRLGDLLCAVRQSRDAGASLRLTIIGQGEASADAQETARALGLTEDVEFAGALPHVEVLARLRNADIAVAPYPKLEGFHFSPLKLFEYMAAGLPTVASAQGQVTDILADGETGLLYPAGDIAALSSCLSRLAEDAALRQRIGMAARAELESHYTWRQTATQVLALCEEAASGAAPILSA